LLAKPTPLNINLGSDRFAMFNKVRDIPRICLAQAVLRLQKHHQIVAIPQS
jgi:hypothetical protein